MEKSRWVVQHEHIHSRDGSFAIDETWAQDKNQTL